MAKNMCRILVDRLEENNFCAGASSKAHACSELVGRCFRKKNFDNINIEIIGVDVS